MAFELLISETTPEGVLVLTLNDPPTRNSLTSTLTEELNAEVDRFAQDSALRVLVITGADPAFCSGANVRGFDRAIRQRDAEADAAPPGPWEQLDPTFTARVGRTPGGPEIVLKLHTLQKPTIAAVNGPAYGLGCGIALSCDFRIASDKARFSEAFVRNGLIPADGSCWQLPKLIGVARTLWMQYTGEPVEGEAAAHIGLVQQTVPHDQLMETTLAMATRLAQGPTVSMALIKQLVLQGFGQTLAEHLTVAARAQALARQTEDHREGVRAFLEKRQPQFKGR
jgi:2-(1,2-epoxy-1,2-dihydrophenyl)acetyl-CoA isomerase